MTHEIIHTKIPHTTMVALNDIQSLIEIALYGGGEWIEKIRYPNEVTSRTIKTKGFGDIPVDADADWGRLSVHEDVGFPVGDHLYCFVSMDASSCLSYYITTAYGSQRELESGKVIGKVIIEPTMDEAVKHLWLNDSYIEFKPYDTDPHPLTRQGLIDAIKAHPLMYEDVLSGEGDQTDADMLLQRALFNDVVFG